MKVPKLATIPSSLLSLLQLLPHHLNKNQIELAFSFIRNEKWSNIIFYGSRRSNFLKRLFNFVIKNI
ncbi:unnamed protein product [Rhizophagus irregularis]|uniref:Uncharacterized protein n=1 Tax=Rhizophagus irregularis TaxID=588596 RepID=A0A915Z8V8_9GLOM|nr:unnamed protein product [Rhizophagus irregularis]CAB5366985.1 unnamed protein product [Rhizophagus irregularis]